MTTKDVTKVGPGRASISSEALLLGKCLSRFDALVADGEVEYDKPTTTVVPVDGSFKVCALSSSADMSIVCKLDPIIFHYLPRRCIVPTFTPICRSPSASAHGSSRSPSSPIQTTVLVHSPARLSKLTSVIFSTHRATHFGTLTHATSSHCHKSAPTACSSTNSRSTGRSCCSRPRRSAVRPMT